MKLIKEFSIIAVTVFFLLYVNIALCGYDPVMGRFQQQDPVGIGPRVVFTSNGPKFVGLNGPVPPSAQIRNASHIVSTTGIQIVSNRYHQVVNPINTVEVSQYSDGMNLYEYVKSNPLKHVDPFGLLCRCGEDVTWGLRGLNDKINEEWLKASEYQKRQVCAAMFNPVTGWDTELHKPELFINESYCCGMGKCKGTVTIDGKCYPAAAVNYWLWGKMRKLCGDTFDEAYRTVIWWKRFHRHLFPDSCTLRWVVAGYYSKIEGVASDGCELDCPPCIMKHYGLDYHIGWRKGIEDYPKEPPKITPLPPPLYGP